MRAGLPRKTAKPRAPAGIARESCLDGERMSSGAGMARTGFSGNSRAGICVYCG
jgi:hypothetical protein